MTFDPLPHQVEGIRFLRDNTEAALFDEQGLGKSKQLIDAVNEQVQEGEIDGALIVCPNTLKTTWAEEVEKHSGEKCVLFGSGKHERKRALRQLRGRFYVINYEAVQAELASLRALLKFRRLALVLDESHRIKTPGARVTEALHELRSLGARRYLLTGTPVANKPEDLWSQFYFLDGGATLGATFEEFREMYGPGSAGYQNLETLRGRTSGVFLRREKDHAVELPPKHVERVFVPLAGAQRTLYDEMRTELAVWVQSMSGDTVVAEGANILARFVRLAQLASNPCLLDYAYTETPAKFSALDELLAVALENDPTQKVIVWTSFTGNVTGLTDRYRPFGAVPLYGGMNQRARDAAVRAFKQDTATRVLVANPAAAREGLTLTSSNLAVYVDRTFNLVDFLQSQDRIHRLSQTRDCHIVLLMAEHSVDEFIDYALAQKLRLAQYAQGTAEEIADEDLRLQKPDFIQALVASESEE